MSDKFKPEITDDFRLTGDWDGIKSELQDRITGIMMQYDANDSLIFTCDKCRHKTMMPLRKPTGVSDLADFIISQMKCHIRAMNKYIGDKEFEGLFNRFCDDNGHITTHRKDHEGEEG